MATATKKRKPPPEPAEPALRLEWLDPATLRENPANWRRHPKRQVKALTAALGEVGWAGALLYNERTQRLIDGHARRGLGKGPVPVLVGSWTEEQERKILATLDPLAAMAETDHEKLDALLNDIGTGTALDDMLAGLAESEKIYVEQEEPERTEPDFAGVLSLWPDVVFPSSNEWGIPDLREDMLSDQVPLRTWGGGPVSGPASENFFLYGTAKFDGSAKGGALGFYVDDHRFEVIWNDAVKIIAKFLKFGWGAVVAPDFSVWMDEPLAKSIWQIYRSRWCARYWQEAGIKVIPSLVYAREAAWPWLFGTLPKRPPVVAIEARNTDSANGKQCFMRSVREGVRALEPGAVLIYGGDDHREWIEPALLSGPNYVWLASWPSLRRKKMAKGVET